MAMNEPTNKPEALVKAPKKVADPRKVHADLLRSQIANSGKMNEVAPQLVELAAEAWTRWQDAAALIRAEGLVIKTAQGYIAHPAAQIERQSCATYTQLLARMGLSATPSQSRYKVNRPTKLAPVTSISELMNREPVKVERSS
jgi:hypothetical protein